MSQPPKQRHETDEREDDSDVREQSYRSFASGGEGVCAAVHFDTAMGRPLVITSLISSSSPSIAMS
jgi:hypothetical protein